MISVLTDFYHEIKKKVNGFIDSNFYSTSFWYNYYKEEQTLKTEGILNCVLSQFILITTGHDGVGFFVTLYRGFHLVMKATWLINCIINSLITGNIPVLYDLLSFYIDWFIALIICLRSFIKIKNVTCTWYSFKSYCIFILKHFKTYIAKKIY